MVGISKRDLEKKLEKLEKDFKEGKISEDVYRNLKNKYTSELKALKILDRLEQMKSPKKEKPKVEKRKKDLKESYLDYKDKGSKIKSSILVTILLAFAIGSAFGLYVLKFSPHTPVVFVNETAFPQSISNATNVTQNFTANETQGYVSYQHPTISYQPESYQQPTPSESHPTPSQNISG